MSKPLQFGCIGVTGYPSVLIGALNRHTSLDEARLAAVDVSMSSPARATREIMDRHQTAEVRGVDALLDYPGLDVLLVATSIDSHLPYTVGGLERGLHVHCEKPITATIEDAYAMIEARDRAGRIVHVGYQDTYGRSVQWAKQKVLCGAIGRVKQVRVMALWPRDDGYYGRNDWAGGMKRGERWVLDSPANNALAHQINIALYVTGASADESNAATVVEAELYRARSITNADTCTMRCQTRSGAEVLILLSHATQAMRQPVVEFIGETGLIRRTHPSRAELVRDGRVVEECSEDESGVHGMMFRNLLDHIHGKVSRSKCEIENALEVTRLINGASEATAVVQVEMEHVERVPARREGEGFISAIEGIEQTFDRCFESFALPSETGVAWARAGGRLSLEKYVKFAGPPVLQS